MASKFPVHTLDWTGSDLAGGKSFGILFKPKSVNSSQQGKREAKERGEAPRVREAGGFEVDTWEAILGAKDGPRSFPRPA